MNTSPNVLEKLKLLRFIGIEIFFNQITLTALNRGATQGANSEIHNAVFSKRKTSRHFNKDLFLGHLQPPLHNNSEDFAIIDDVTVKTI